jgi:hypothetical protein
MAMRVSERFDSAPAALRSARTDAGRVLALAVLLAVPMIGYSQAHFSGAWKIEQTEPAPWVQKPDMTDADEMKRLYGKTIEFKADRVAGPDPLACSKPHYEIKTLQAAELFQGSLAEYADPATSPDKLADKIGFGKRPIATLETGCASGIDFHLLDRDHAIFALNNTFYRITRAKAAAKKHP